MSISFPSISFEFFPPKGPEGAARLAPLGPSFFNAEAAGAAELLSVSIASEICERLRREGTEQIHFHTLNNPDPPCRVCQALGVETAPMEIAAAAGCA